MSNLVIPAPKQITIPIHESDQEFPVRRIYCIGRNYAAHTIEMGFDPDKEPPFFFQKNTDNIDISGEFPYPPESKDVHYELELIVALKSGGSNINLYSTIASGLTINGRPTQMGAFSRTIEDDDIWRIIAYMRQEYKDRKAAGSEFKYGVYP